MSKTRTYANDTPVLDVFLELDIVLGVGVGSNGVESLSHF